MSENGNKHPVLKTIGTVATAVAAICGVVIGVMNYMTEGKQDMVQESTFNILMTRVNQNVEQMRAIDQRLFELAMICGGNHEEEDEMMSEEMSPEMHPVAERPDPPSPMPEPVKRFDDFKQVQQYVIEKNVPWEEER